VYQACVSTLRLPRLNQEQPAMKASSPSILVSLNDVAQLPNILLAARHLAKLLHAQVLGLYVIPAEHIYPMMGHDMVAQSYDATQMFYVKNRDQVKKAYETAMKAEGIEHVFEEVQGQTTQIAPEVAEHGRAHDLILIAAPQNEGAFGTETDLAERVVMLAGRPVVVLPPGGVAKLDFSSIVLGWDGGREAARATFDALPLLRKAKRVQIAGVDVPTRGQEPAAQIAETLAHHGVKVEIAHVPSDGFGAGDALLRSAKEFGAGLIVMGAYGHSRFTELIFGGATRHVLHHLNLPVLMSH
jgi:nucleotide-binding universal stress UspA family protein